MWMPMARRAFLRACVHVVVLSSALPSLAESTTAAGGHWLEVAVKRQRVVSSNLATVGYNHRAKVLEIEFHTGSIYRYRGVPDETHAALLSAESKGQYFARQIRGRYEFRRMN